LPIDRPTATVLFRNAGGFQVAVEDFQQTGRDVEQRGVGRQAVDQFFLVRLIGIVDIVIAEKGFSKDIPH